MSYKCKCCGWTEKAHDIIKEPWLQLDLFKHNPSKRRTGRIVTLVDCQRFTMSQKDIRISRRPFIQHEVWAIFTFANGQSRVVDIGG